MEPPEPFRFQMDILNPMKNHFGIKRLYLSGALAQLVEHWCRMRAFRVRFSAWPT